MKPTFEQKQLCDTIKMIVSTWMNTNDINSPTHDSDIRELIYSEWFDRLSETDIENLEDSLHQLLWFIRDYKYEIEKS